MKKIALVFILLILFAGTAFAEFGFENDTYSSSCIVRVTNPYNNQYYLAGNFVQLNVTGVDDMITQYGTNHTVSYEVTDGVTNVDLDLWEKLDKGLTRHYLECCVNNTEAMTPGTSSTVKITLNWGEKSISTTLTINYISVEIPEIKWADTINMTAGEACTVSTKFTSIDFPFNGIVYLNYSANPSSILTRTGHGEGFSNNEVWTSLKIDDPGYYQGQANFRVFNLFVTKDLVFDVAANSSQTEYVPQIGFSYDNNKPFTDTTVTLAVIKVDDSGIGNHSSIFRINILNYDDLLSKIGGAPVWTVDYPKQRYSKLELKTYDNAPHAVFVNTERYTPESACSMPVIFHLNWGKISYNISMTIKFVETTLPDNYFIPSTVKMDVGETKTLQCGFEPQGYTFSDMQMVQCTLDKANFDDLFEIVEYDGWNIKIRPKTTTTGSWHGRITVRDMNINAANYDVTFIVGDADVLAFKNENQQVTIMPAFEDNESIGLSHDGWMGNIQLYDVNGTPSWDIQMKENAYGTTAYMTAWKNGLGADIHLENEPTVPCILTATVTCTLGDQTITTKRKIKYETPASLPKGLNVSDKIEELKINTASQIEVNCIDNYEYGGFNDVYIYSSELTYDSSVDNSTITITPQKAGVFSATVYKRLWGMVLEKEVLLYVQNESGIVPELVPYFDISWSSSGVFETDFYIGTAASATGKGWMCDLEAFAWWLDNLPALREAYGENPEINWSYTYKDGLELPLVLTPENNLFVKGDSCSVAFESLPTSTGTMTFDLNCEWNGHKGTLPCKIDIKTPSNVPSDLTMNDVYVIRNGDEKEISGHFAPGNYSVEEAFFRVFADGEYVRFDRVDDRFTLKMTALKSGTVSARGVVGVNNGFVQKFFTIRIVDREIELPTSLTVIESGAFAGIKNAVFYLPSTIKTISSDAFDSSAVIVCGKGSQAESICNGYGLTVVTE